MERASPAEISLSRRAFLSLAAAASARAQNTTFSANVKVVNVLATVRNRQGEIVPNLNKDDFVLEEDGRPQTIRYFARETDLPLTLGLLVDTSGSERRLIGQEQTASYRFLVQVLREDKDLAFLIHFDREVELLQDLTSSRKRLEIALADLDQGEQPVQWGRRGSPGGGRGRFHGGTALYDAVYLACDEIMRKQHGRKALILMSDGEDNASREPLSTAVASAQKADTLVYSILFADDGGFGGGFGGYGMGRRHGGPGRMPERRPDGKKVLEEISVKTGGAFFEVSKKQTLEDIFNRIQQELRNQYSLGYTSDKPALGEEFRTIAVSTRRPDLIVQARRGYYATK